MFKKYNSIENSYRSKFLDRIKAQGYWKDEFIVQEKVHGANLSYWTQNGQEFYAAKRTAAIGSEERFFNYEEVLEVIQPGLTQIWKSLKATLGAELEQLTIFGEIIGGTYPHPDVKQNAQAIKVQKGIHYSPHNHFYAFDIMVNTTTYLNVDAANDLFKETGLLYAKTLFRGSIEDCLAYPNDFDSTVPEDLGLPSLTPNIVEGTIVRPAITRYLGTGNRIILKNKNERWSEKKRQAKTARPAPVETGPVAEMKAAILEYVTENRLNNVLSKLGAVTKKDFGRIMGLFNKDVVEDFSKDYEANLAELSKKECKTINKSIGVASAALIHETLNVMPLVED